MTGRAPSLERRLVLSVVGVLGLALSGFSMALYAAFERVAVSSFDARLMDDAQAVGQTIEEHADGSFEVEGSPEDIERAEALPYFEARVEGGRVLAKSRGLGGAELSYEPEGPSARDVTLPGGRLGRRYQTEIRARWDDESPAPAERRRVFVAVARDRSDIDAGAAALRGLLTAAGLSMLALSVIAAVIAVRRGFLPVSRLSARIEAIDATRLGERLPVEGLPRELETPVAKLNELLGRLEVAFQREKQFASDASHELRTPIAGMRTTLEVTLRRERTPAEYRRAIEEALAILKQTAGLVETLLALSRSDARSSTLVTGEVGLHDLVEQCFLPLAGAAHTRGLSFENAVPERAVVVTDREKLGLVVSNLLDNAVRYTETGGAVRVDSKPAAGLIAEVADSGPAVPEGDLERIFDRFVRLDPSRTDAAEHAGIGLALARSVCAGLGFEVNARNEPNGGVAFRVTRPGAESR